jgi:hypothetical protein
MTKDLAEAIADAIYGGNQHKVDACVVQDKLGWYFDMGLHVGQDLVKCCGWTLIVIVYGGYSE